MKQVFQNVGNGETSVEELPSPRCKAGHILIKSTNSLISAGTERMLVDFGKSSYLQKARKQPEKVQMVLDKMKTDGVLQTIDSVKSKLDQPMAMGYSNVGVVIEVGQGVSEFSIGDRVVSNGRHAEIVCVPKNLCAAIPDNVSDSDAVFTVVGAIALQGIRLAAPTIGETVVVMGLGLIGLITIQILKANGCRVLGLDFDATKTKLAQSLGIETVTLGQKEDPLLAAQTFSRGRGVDAVIITAATESNEPVHHAALMCRAKGRIVLVGVVGLDLQRGDFYEKEISFQVSCSYGPGRYDPDYEELGRDYPVGYVRWTEKRNFEAVLDMFEAGVLSVDELKTGEFDIQDAAQAYAALLSDKAALGILIRYNFENVTIKSTVSLPAVLNKATALGKTVIGAIGAGNHAGRTLLPAFKATDCRMKTIASSLGMTGAHYGKKFGFELNTTNVSSMLEDEEINSLVIATQHDSHAKFVIEALNHGKHVFVEKPLALTHSQLDEIQSAYDISQRNGTLLQVTVGFNRRFSPLIQTLKSSLNSVEPMSIIYTCNAGGIPAESWVHDIEKGGGRIVGEACHFIDIARFLTGSKITKVKATGLVPQVGVKNLSDTASISLVFENGSIATIHYFSNGHRAFPKERVEVFQSNGVAVLDNFKELRGFGIKGLKKIKKFRQDKGINNCVQAFVDSVNNGGSPAISFEEVMEVSRVSIDAANQLIEGKKG